MFKKLKSRLLEIRTQLMFRKLFRLSSQMFILNQGIQRSALPESVKKQSEALLDAYCSLNNAAAYSKNRRSNTDAR